MSRTITAPEIIESPVGTGRWMVLIFDNDHTCIDDVMAMLMRSTGCTAHEAWMECWEAQEFGKAPVHFAERTECEIVATMMGTIGVRTEVRREWED